MNPPSALFGAMNKERKPFTYTPGGLDLSEIKSERMAQRLMRNAMNQGVPETPAHSVKSPPASGIPVAIPNFNCLPVQVFPSFQLPANPKSLLRTRSNPDGLKQISNNVSKVPQIVDNVDKNINRQYINHSQNYDNSVSNSNNAYNVIANNFYTLPKVNYDIITNTEPATYSNNNLINDFEIDKSKATQRDANEVHSFDFSKYMNNNTLNNNELNSIEENPFKKRTDKKEDTTDNENKQEEISVNKSNEKTEEDVENRNGDTETAVIVKLPTKKSAAKTETKVEVVQKSLPDGSIQEVKTTTTRTTIDGKTEISTKTETKIISKEETDEETYEEEEEEEVEDEDVEYKKINVTAESITKNTEVRVDNISSKNTTTEDEKLDEKQSIKENGGIIKQEENIETSTTKKVVVIQSEVQDSEEEAEEVEEDIEEVEEEEEDVDQDVEEVIVIKKQNITNSEPNDTQDEENELEKNSENNENTAQENEDNEDDKIDEECEFKENKTEENKKDGNEISSIKEKDILDEEKENIDSQIESDQKGETNVNKNENNNENENSADVYEEAIDRDNDNEKGINDLSEESSKPISTLQEKDKSEIKAEEIIIPIQTETTSNKISDKCDVKLNEKLRTENKDSFTEPSIPLEKVEEIEIKPIGAPGQEIITKSHKEIISTTTDKSSGALSTQTEYNIIENIVSVNRTTKTLDHAYEQAGEYTIPVVKTSLIPDNSGTLPPPPIFNRTYQSNYSKEPSTERRHSLLLERLSVERQIPTPSIYQTDNAHSNLGYDGRQLPSEAQSEILIESNVKPSMVNKNQQWYARKDSYDNIAPTGTIPSQQWNQSQQQQLQPQPQPQPQSQPQYQPQVQPQYQYTPQNQCFNQTVNSQTQYSPQPQPQPVFTDYKQYSNSYNQNSYPAYTPKPSWVSSTVDPKPTSLSQSNQYLFESESFQKSTHNQNSYVPPPWEQDTGYNVNNLNQNNYQSQPPPTTPTIKSTPSWKPPNNKFTKIPTTSYVPPAPNQSFVKSVSVVDPPKLSGRKTYYSEYERRYITVPESTYIPTETKYQAQPDPSPQYYYDQNEPVETVEPQWRKELREFTEKTQTSSQTIETSVRPPWEEEPKYVTSSDLSNTQTWSQTLRPRSYRERSIESEYTSTAKEWSKTNSLGRGRPQSSYINNLKRIPERPRGVSVDRYNPNIYQSPLSGEHPPVQSQTLDPSIHPKPHYNPNVPAYHSRGSAEPREQPVYSQPRGWVDSRAPPVQSRSFKYLQWITGTED